jgi:hypothetical protein
MCKQSKSLVRCTMHSDYSFIIGPDGFKIGYLLPITPRSVTLRSVDVIMPKYIQSKQLKPHTTGRLVVEKQQCPIAWE